MWQQRRQTQRQRERDTEKSLSFPHAKVIWHMWHPFSGFKLLWLCFRCPPLSLLLSSSSLVILASLATLFPPSPFAFLRSVATFALAFVVNITYLFKLSVCLPSAASLSLSLLPVYLSFFSLYFTRSLSITVPFLLPIWLLTAFSQRIAALLLSPIAGSAFFPLSPPPPLSLLSLFSEPLLRKLRRNIRLSIRKLCRVWAKHKEAYQAASSRWAANGEKIRKLRKEENRDRERKKVGI